MAASRVVLSYPADLSDWGRRALEDPSFSAYLGKVHETAAEGDVWAEFLGVGCCGDTRDISLHIEAVEGAEAVGEDTEFVFEARSESDGQGGWLVQSADGPTG
jgi:hypothetical protein